MSYTTLDAVNVTEMNPSGLYNNNPIALSFHEVSLTMQGPKPSLFGKREKIQILHEVSGYVKPGQLIGILGGSGSGKTSLLNVLSGRVDNGEITGEIYANGTKLNNNKISSTIKKVAGYVTQDDHLLPNLTVRETLEYAALLKLPLSIPKAEKLNMVDSVIRELRLLHCANTKIGNEFVRGVSGGERRRVSIGVQLLTNPSVVFMDEPTSGLDSTTAHQLIELLVKVARNNRTVICTLHQPRSDIFDMFDSVMLLSKGRVVYFGPGGGKPVADYFRGFGFECPLYCNVADFVVDAINVDTKSELSEQESKARVKKLVDGFDETELGQTIKQRSKAFITHAELDGSTLLTPLPERLSDLTPESGFISSFFQFMVLMRRSTKNILRDRMSLISRFLYSIIIAVMFGGIFYKLGTDQQGAQDRYSTLNRFLTITPFMTILAYVVRWQSDRVIYTRERRDNMYSATAYYFSKMLTEIPLEIINTFIFCSICYWMMDLNPQPDRFFIFFGIMTLVIHCAMCVGYVFAALITTFQGASAAANALFTFSFLSSGWALNLSSITKALSWIEYVSFIKYGYEALLLNEFIGESFTCASHDQICRFSTGEDVIKSLSMQDARMWKSTAFLGGMGIFLQVCFYLLIRFKNQIK